jgi:D-serine deaminase-like pyridoxal phosphate-dependent protein
MERNIKRMAEFFKDGPCRLRPHFKAHKTPEIARRQLAGGSCSGLTCATVSEAETVIDLCEDLLIANEVIDPVKCARVAQLAHRGRLTVAVDSSAGLEAMGRAARDARVSIGVLVDVNVGQMRCGVRPGQGVVRLAQHAAEVAGVELRGVMGYEGHLMGVGDRKERERRTREAMNGLVESAEMLRAAGLTCDVVSGGGTGTYDISGRVPGVTEIQAGSYVVMDSDYGQLDVPFEQAFWVVGTVISRPETTRLVVDSGHKSMTKDHGLPGVRDLSGGTVVSLNDEHATIHVTEDCSARIGDRLFLRPSHTDPTINLHDAFYALENDRVVDVWPIAARGYREHR